VAPLKKYRFLSLIAPKLNFSNFFQAYHQTQRRLNFQNKPKSQPP
jgi:hypothetical protein